MMRKRASKYLAEALGTFCLVFVGTGVIVVNETSQGQISFLGICLAFGLMVLAMIYAIGHISGAHMNPAVTLGFFAAGRMGKEELLPYIGSQLVGAVLASVAVKFIFAANSYSALGATLPSGSLAQSFAVEFLLTFILMFVVMAVATDERAEGAMAGVAIGAIVTAGALVGAQISGASMNPARSFAPALVSSHWAGHWIYWAAPILGSCAGARAYQAVQCQDPTTKEKSGCC